MDYRRMREESRFAAQRELTLQRIILVLVLIIAVMTSVCVIVSVGNYQYKVMYEEALQTQINMQSEINSLKGAGQEVIEEAAAEENTEPEFGPSAENADDEGNE